jgi:hypothetical protein
MWPGVIVQHLVDQLPEGYVAEPRVHLGAFYEIDLCAFERDTEQPPGQDLPGASNGGVATAVQAAPSPTLTLDAEFLDEYAYEVLIFDVERERQLVAAVEFVSPANKDRPQSRQLFVTKCYNLLRSDVCVSIIDLVTIRQFNLFAELLALVPSRDPRFTIATPPTYAVTCRKRTVGRQTKMDAWYRPLAVGQPLPTLPVWLSPDHYIELDLEASYEETCRVLRIR